LVEHPALQNVRLIQSLLAGINNYEGVDLPKGAKFCNGGDIHLMPTAWHTSLMVGMVLKQFPRWFENTKAGQWKAAYHELLGRRKTTMVPDGEYRGVRGLRNSRILVLGMGPIGIKTANILKAQGAQNHNIEGIAYTVDNQDVREGYTVYSRDRMHERLKLADIVICLLPGTPEAQNTIGEAELKLIKSTTVIINAGRGGTVNEAAIKKAIEAKQIAYYATDVATEEPAKPNWILHKMHDFFFTPHIAGGGEDAFDAAADMLSDNIAALKTGSAFRCLVHNVAQGYRGWVSPTTKAPALNA
jgi:phosphoglycerate dehydrogenase-like enzyme